MCALHFPSLGPVPPPLSPDADPSLVSAALCTRLPVATGRLSSGESCHGLSLSGLPLPGDQGLSGANKQERKRTEAAAGLKSSASSVFDRAKDKQKTAENTAGNKISQTNISGDFSLKSSTQKKREKRKKFRNHTTKGTRYERDTENKLI